MHVLYQPRKERRKRWGRRGFNVERVRVLDDPHAVRSAGGSSQSKSPVMRVRVTGPSEGSRVESQLVNSGRHPSWCGSRYTMPQRDTVAGDATARSATSM
jgi:hypothetical protein